jgi:hypothetical protein
LLRLLLLHLLAEACLMPVVWTVPWMISLVIPVLLLLPLLLLLLLQLRLLVVACLIQVVWTVPWMTFSVTPVLLLLPLHLLPPRLPLPLLLVAVCLTPVA